MKRAEDETRQILAAETGFAQGRIGKAHQRAIQLRFVPCAVNALELAVDEFRQGPGEEVKNVGYGLRLAGIGQAFWVQSGA